MQVRRDYYRGWRWSTGVRDRELKNTYEQVRHALRLCFRLPLQGSAGPKKKCQFKDRPVDMRNSRGTRYHLGRYEYPEIHDSRIRVASELHRIQRRPRDDSSAGGV